MDKYIDDKDLSKVEVGSDALMRCFAVEPQVAEGALGKRERNKRGLYICVSLQKGASAHQRHLSLFLQTVFCDALRVALGLTDAHQPDGGAK